MLVERIYFLNPKLTPVQLADAIMERLNKIQALICLGQSDDMLDCMSEHIDNYFWLHSGLINELKELFDAFSQKTLMVTSQID
jgi:esterase/lipase superfamily enzyme